MKIKYLKKFFRDPNLVFCGSSSRVFTEYIEEVQNKESKQFINDDEIALGLSILTKEQILNMD